MAKVNVTFFSYHNWSNSHAFTDVDSPNTYLEWFVLLLAGNLKFYDLYSETHVFLHRIIKIDLLCTSYRTQKQRNMTIFPPQKDNFV